MGSGSCIDHLVWYPCLHLGGAALNTAKRLWLFSAGLALAGLQQLLVDSYSGSVTCVGGRLRDFVLSTDSAQDGGDDDGNNEDQGEDKARLNRRRAPDISGKYLIEISSDLPLSWLEYFGVVTSTEVMAFQFSQQK